MNLASQLDPQLAEGLRAFDVIDIDESSLAVTSLPRTTPPLSNRVVRADHVVGGDVDVPIRVHRSTSGSGPRACVISMHAGGYVLGDLDMDDALFESWCDELGVIGVSIGYRLAPATAYPGPLMDCYRVVQWVHAHAESLGVDAGLIGLHGVGAGAGLAAALALVVRDHREIRLAFQILDSPMLDDRQRPASGELDLWTSRSTEFGWRSYLGDLYGTADVPGYAAAARAERLRGLPPAFVSVGELAAFRDEDVGYAQRLNEAGVPAELHVYPAAPHGYQLVAESDVCRQAVRDKTAWLSRQITREVEKPE